MSEIMNTGYRYIGADFVIPEPVKLSDWQVDISGIKCRPIAGQEPNAFHRMMQRLALGFKWDKVE